MLLSRLIVDFPQNCRLYVFADMALEVRNEHVEQSKDCPGWRVNQQPSHKRLREKPVDNYSAYNSQSSCKLHTSSLEDRHATNFAEELMPLARPVITQTSHRTPYCILPLPICVCPRTLDILLCRGFFFLLNAHLLKSNLSNGHSWKGGGEGVVIHVNFSFTARYI